MGTQVQHEILQVLPKEHGREGESSYGIDVARLFSMNRIMP
jgi:hypothetical protein